MNSFDITREMIFYPPHEGKPVPGLVSLSGNMPVTEKAAKRPKGSKPTLCFSIAMACKCLMISGGTAETAQCVGLSSETTPRGIKMSIQKGAASVWAVSRDLSSTSKFLEVSGGMFSSGVLNYYVGIALARFMALNHASYPDFIASVKGVMNAKTSNDQEAVIKCITKMSDEITFALENMISGKDPLGISVVRLVDTEPTDMDASFDADNLLSSAFSSIDELNKLIQTSIKAKTIDSIFDDGTKISTSFVGTLPTRLSNAISRGKSVLLTGPTATGKTQCVREVCHSIKAPLSYIGGSEGLEDIDVIGAMVQDANGKWIFTDGPLVEAFRNGASQAKKWEDEKALAVKESRDPVPVPPAILLIDEINRMQSRFQNIFVSSMNVRPVTSDYYLRIPSTNEEISCPVSHLVFIGARNFGSSYIGTNPMDLALERRFYLKIDVDYLSSDDEASLIIKRTGVDKKLAKALVRIASDSRNQLSQLKAPIDTDTLLKWAEELAYIQNNGVVLTDKIVLDIAKDIVFDVVLERTERGGFDQSGESIMSDNILESWKETYKR